MFRNTREKLANISKVNILLIIIFITGLVYSTLYVYNNYIKPKMDPTTFLANKEIISGTQYESDITFQIYYVEWCKYSKKAMKVWEKFRDNNEGKKIFQRFITFEEIDCDKEDEAELTKLNIQGYPTIKKIIKDKDKKIVNSMEYHGKVTEDGLEKFLKEDF